MGAVVWKRRRPRELHPDDHWSGEGAGPRIVVEEADPELRSSMADALQSAGYRTATCASPGLDGRGRCPLVRGPGCSVVEDADAVVSVATPGDGPENEVRAAIRAKEPDVAVVVVVPALTGARRPDLPAGSSVWTGPLTGAGVVAAVDRALGPDRGVDGVAR